MAEFKITKTTNLTDLEKGLRNMLSGTNAVTDVRLARQRKHQFFKDPALAQFFATLARRGPFTLVDWHNEWKPKDFDEYYVENLAGLSGVTFGTRTTNTSNASPPLSPADIRKSIIGRHGLLKPYGDAQSKVRELTFVAFDPEAREPAALAGLIYDPDGFIRTVQKWREQLLDINPVRHQDLFATPGAPRPIMEFLHELYQNGAEHGNRSADNKLIPGIRTVSMQRHNPGSMNDLLGFAKGFAELEKYIEDWSKLNRGTSFIEVSANDVGLGIIDRFVATRPEFLQSAVGRDARLKLLLRILLTPESSHGTGTYEQAYSSKDVSGQERGAGRGLERALDAVRKLNGFVSLRTAEFWLYRSFPDGEEIGKTAMHEVGNGLFAPVVGTCFTALFPINLQA